MPYWSDMNMQEPNSSISMRIMNLHEHAIFIMIIVMSIIAYTLYALMFMNLTNRNIKDAQMIETIWTIIPGLLLFTVAIPSIRLLYDMEDLKEPLITIKSTGHQWYWSYEYNDLKNLSFDSYMMNTNDLNKGNLRLLEVDNRLIMPYSIETRMLITSADVLHSWTIPSLGIKMDAVPGRINQVSFMPISPGIYYGQCSEICGVNHSFMPISIEVIKPSEFINWSINFNN
uniref:cytochrome c oxidase subunit II n=1 Tax=Acanthobdella peledina TaxID=60939 RepID=UPI0020277951|nr:cytochrome c oxidase subunit II [Acanthobdella peledina]QYC97724.1 cytochrome c oxidase subunit 2 [Acanthobdella peledina]UZT67786.1 cytochrome c oxidase subunit II [Acanthobdella peledina]UZT67799.1 cytochrome c oxidase subunit II [Acanthobdella peledina]UZT67851.1 cytochrome c oxidase subunit II [Acanthobdella peledina]UZT67864.1 cytochrome c oxidase subunit II [Acanthobdella peledina]